GGGAPVRGGGRRGELPGPRRGGAPAARLSWNRRYRGRIATGTHRVEVVAQSALGRSGLVRRVPFGN
ncbi:MAG TPA: hypothetical protein PKE32_06840, partial [Miltoncostaeaceae bacterium]|nr:hypothetical protein [Miltoncostaeaceae bacterium]